MQNSCVCVDGRILCGKQFRRNLNADQESAFLIAAHFYRTLNVRSFAHTFESKKKNYKLHLIFRKKDHFDDSKTLIEQQNTQI